MNPVVTQILWANHEDTQLPSGFSNRHWNGRNSASFAKSRAMAVILRWLGEGECEAIMLAEQHGQDVLLLMDEGRGRRELTIAKRRFRH